MKRINKILILISVLLIILIVLMVFDTKKEQVTVINRDKEIKEAKKSNNEYGYTIGWLKIYNSTIDLPVINITKSEKGWDEAFVELDDYAWNLGNDNKFHNRMTILGHNIMNLSSNPRVGDSDFKRFDDLMGFVYYDYAKDHEYFQYSLNGKTRVYKIYAVYFTSALVKDEYESVDCDKDRLETIIKSQKRDSIYDYNVDVNGNDNIMMLDTCTRFYGTASTDSSFVVAAREVRKNEKTYSYKVSKNKNYKVVEDNMKGSEEDEKA